MKSSTVHAQLMDNDDDLHGKVSDFALLTKPHGKE